MVDKWLQVHSTSRLPGTAHARCFDRWRKFDGGRQTCVRVALERIRDCAGLARVVVEVVGNPLQ